MGTGIKKSGFARSGLTALAGLAVVAGSLAGATALAPAAAAAETITVAPSPYTDPTLPLVVTVNGFANMAGGSSNASVYIYTLTFPNMTGSKPAGRTGCGTGSGNTGVAFTRTAGPAVSPIPNGGTYSSVTYPACEWVSSTQFRFVYEVPANQTLLNSTSVVDLTFDAGVLAAPVSGTYSTVFTAGANNQWALSTWCFQDCPVDYVAGAAPTLITIDIDANGGICKTSKVTGPQGTWGVAPDRFNCTRGVDILTGYNTSADGSGISIAPEGNIHFTGDNRVYAQWFDPRTQAIPAGPVRNVVATSKWSRVQVNWDAPLEQGSFPVTNYLVQATPGRSVCITRLTDKKLTQCSFNNLTPGTKYTFKAQALTQAGWGEMSVASNQAAPYEVRATGSDRKKGGLFQLFKSEAKVSGTAKGYPAGTRIHSWYKLGDGAWAEGSEVKSDASGNFKWSKKFERKYDGTTIQVQFSAEPLGSPWIKNAKYNSESMDFSNIVTVGKAK